MPPALSEDVCWHGIQLRQLNHALGNWVGFPREEEYGDGGWVGSCRKKVTEELLAEWAWVGRVDSRL